ncbi:MAG: alpha/beta hydrolase [Saprospiraceae bacterium]
MTNGQSLAYIEKGSGEQTLLMIHGLGNNSLAWKKMMENLQADFRCIAIDPSPIMSYPKQPTTLSP